MLASSGPIRLSEQGRCFCFGDVMKAIEIKRLRPTQATHGRREVQQKTVEYVALEGHDLDMAIASKPIPVVLGPGGNVFAIDHHHVAAALWAAQIEQAPVVLVSDISSLCVNDFWLEMENKRWTYPYNARGGRISFSNMPRHVYELENDEYRSVAGFVRDAGGYEKTTVPLEEFRWADFFRANIPLPESDEDFASAVRHGVSLAKGELAIGLPGFIGLDGKQKQQPD